MKDLIKQIICVKESYTAINGEVKTKYRFYFELNNNSRIEFCPYYSNFSNDDKNYSTFGDIYKYLVDSYETKDKTKKVDSKKNEK